jgi:hypothetical protein
MEEIGMPSPFPGMDPWLEGSGFFPDVHHSLIFLLKESLNASLPEGYAAFSNRLVWTEDTQIREPDVGVLNGKGRKTGSNLQELEGLVAVAVEPIPEEVEEIYLEILDLEADKQLITVIEILSHSNKLASGAGRTAYKKKQQEFLAAGVNIVELDLLRKGTHTTLVPLALLKNLNSNFSYHVSVVTCGENHQYFANAISMQQSLPTIGIPLKAGDKLPVVDIQGILNRIYDMSRYSLMVKYSQPPEYPLTPDQQQWANTILTQSGLLKP